MLAYTQTRSGKGKGRRNGSGQGLETCSVLSFRCVCVSFPLSDYTNVYLQTWIAIAPNHHDDDCCRRQHNHTISIPHINTGHNPSIGGFFITFNRGSRHNMSQAPGMFFSLIFYFSVLKCI